MNMTGHISRSDTENRRPEQKLNQFKTEYQASLLFVFSHSRHADMHVCVCAGYQRHSGSTDVIVISKTAGLIRNYETKSCPWKIQFKVHCDRDIYCAVLIILSQLCCLCTLSIMVFTGVIRFRYSIGRVFVQKVRKQLTYCASLPYLTQEKWRGTISQIQQPCFLIFGKLFPILNAELNEIHLLTPYSTVILEKLTGSELVKKFPEFYGTRKFKATFTTARHLSLS